MSTRKKTMGKKAMLETMAQRIFAYNLLSRTFVEEANYDFLKALIDNDMLSSYPFRERDEALAPALEEASFYLKDPDVLSEDSIILLGSEFISLFVGPGKMKAVPYESVYLSDKGLVFQDETIRVRHAYQREGFQPKNLKREPDDHMGLELDFMAKLSEKAYEAARSEKYTAARRSLMAMKSFLEEHLLKWMDKFVDNIIQGAENDFYRGMAKVLRSTIRLDVELLDELTSAVNDQYRKRKAKANID